MQLEKLIATWLINVFLFYRGNFPNVPPYAKGVPCSMCEEEETCVKKLCSKQRGKQNICNISFEEQSP